MSRVPHWFLWLLIINTILALLYAVLGLLHKKEKRHSRLIRTAVMLMCPVVGICVIFLSWLLFRVVFHREVDLSDVVFSKERVESLSKANEELERNFVPLEEAIAITDKRDLRTLMLNIVRSDVDKSLKTISLALNSEDSETSHYAAAVLQGAINDFRMQIQRERKMVMEQLDQPEEEENDSKAAAVHLMMEINQMLEKKVLTAADQKAYADMLDEIGEKVYGLDDGAMDCDALSAAALRILEVKNYERSAVWCQRLLEHFPDTLAAYTCRLKLYYSTGERERFFDVLNRLRESKIVVDSETLELIRVFS